MPHVITKAIINEKIKGVSITSNTSVRTTIASIVMKNGISVVGVDSGLNDGTEFDRDLSEVRALNDAYNQIYKFENYLLCEKLYEEKLKLEEQERISKLPVEHQQI